MANCSSIFCLENPKDRGAWHAAVHGVAKSRTQLNMHAFSKEPGLCTVLHEALRLNCLNTALIASLLKNIL